MLNQISTEQLVQELKRREKKAKELAKPKMLAVPARNPEYLEKVCQEYIDFIASDEYHEDNDYKNYIYENAIEMLFGSEIWEWINSKM
jgi:chorismate mutase